MATTVTMQQKPYTTGAGMNYPVIIKALPNQHDYIFQAEVKDASEIAIGCLAQIITTTGTLDLCSGSSTIRPVIVLDTEHNKALIEAANGATATKALFFAAGAKVDVSLLVPGMIVSVRVAYAGGGEATLLWGDSLKVGATTVTGVEKDATDLATRIGIALAEANPGNSLLYMPMLVV